MRVGETPLLDAFDAMIGWAELPSEVRKPLLEAFMAGAAHYEIVLTKALQTDDPEEVARCQDNMAREINTRHEPTGNLR